MDDPGQARGRRNDESPGSVPDNPRRQRLYALLARRGFTYDTIRRVLDLEEG